MPAAALSLKYTIERGGTGMQKEKETGKMKMRVDEDKVDSSRERKVTRKSKRRLFDFVCLQCRSSIKSEKKFEGTYQPLEKNVN